jgi:hypothetical protein
VNDITGLCAVTPYYHRADNQSLDAGIIGRSDAVNPTPLYLNASGVVASYDGTSSRTVAGVPPDNQCFNVANRWFDSDTQRLYREDTKSS